MGFQEAIRTCLKEKYFTFSGRASRSEYWYFILLLAIVGIAAVIVMLTSGMLQGTAGTATFVVLGFLGVLYLGLIIPSISVAVRRYHDRNLSGWWVLGVVIGGNIPYIGILISIASRVICCLKGTEGDNKFGQDPLQEQNSADVFA